MKHRNAMYGVCAVWIVLYHVNAFIRRPMIYGITHIIGYGNMGVDVFLFLSAIGLSYSIEQNNLVQFYKNRVFKVVIPFVAISLPFYLWQNFRQDIGVFSFLNFLGDISTLSYWFRSDYAVWYVAFIIVFYALYPLLYKMYRKNRFYILWLIVSVVALEIIAEVFQWHLYTNCERAFSRIPIFLFGIFVSDDVKEDKYISEHKVLSLFVMLVFIMFNLVFQNYI